MNPNQPYITVNRSGAVVLADPRVPKGTGRISVIPVTDEILDNCIELTPEAHEAIAPESLAEFLADIDRVGMTYTVDLALWVDAQDRWPDVPPQFAPHQEILDMLDTWVAEHDDCPSLYSLLDDLDGRGIGRTFDLLHWLSRWRRA